MCLRQECLVASTTRDARLTSMKLSSSGGHPEFSLAGLLSSGCACTDVDSHAPPASGRIKGTRQRPLTPGARTKACSCERGAYKDLCRLAAQDEAARASTPGTQKRRRTVLGTDRRKLMTVVSGVDSAEPGAKTVRYRAATAKNWPRSVRNGFGPAPRMAHPQRG